MTHLVEIAMVQSRSPPRTAQAAYFVTPISIGSEQQVTVQSPLVQLKKAVQIEEG